MLIEVAPGELLDKITILQIKRQRLRDRDQLTHVFVELGALLAAWSRSLRDPEGLTTLTDKLMEINSRLWEVEDELRICEREGEFGSRFIELARTVYKLNDRRSQLKRQINELCGSVLIEEKSYESYGSGETPSLRSDLTSGPNSNPVAEDYSSQNSRVTKQEKA